MQDDSQLTSDCDLRIAQTAALGEPHAPGVQRRSFGDAGEQHIGGFEEITAQHGVAAFRDPPCPIDLAGCVTPCREAEIQKSARSGAGLTLRSILRLCLRSRPISIQTQRLAPFGACRCKFTKRKGFHRISEPIMANVRWNTPRGFGHDLCHRHSA